MPVLESRILAAESGAPSPASDGATGTFRHEGDYWTIAFEGDAFRIKHSKGIAYLARLLERPGQELHALDLAGARAANTASSAIGELSVGTEDGAGPMLDEAAKAAYRTRVEELRSEIAQGEEWNDTERAARARTELEVLTSELAAAVGLGGRDRQSASATERARVSVTRAIRGAIDRVSAESPALGSHLEATIRTGTYCSYTPDRAHRSRGAVEGERSTILTADVGNCEYAGHSTDEKWQAHRSHSHQPQSLPRVTDDGARPERVLQPGKDPTS